MLRPAAIHCCPAPEGLRVLQLPMKQRQGLERELHREQLNDIQQRWHVLASRSLPEVQLARALLLLNCFGLGSISYDVQALLHGHTKGSALSKSDSRTVSLIAALLRSDS